MSPTISTLWRHVTDSNQDISEGFFFDIFTRSDKPCNYVSIVQTLETLKRCYKMENVYHSVQLGPLQPK